MRRLIVGRPIFLALFLTACAAPVDGVQRTRMRDCPPGTVQICESKQEPSRGGDEEIPLYERCTCKSIY